MADLSRQNLKNRFLCTIEIQAYLRDHFFEGKAVFPAVEAMIVLANAVQSVDPQANLHMMTGAHFSRMLVLEPEIDRLEAQIEIDSNACGIRASLLTLIKIKTGAISRTLEHARVTFARTNIMPEPLISFRDACRLKNECIGVPAASIYRELIPFGPSYRNIVGDLSVSADGALAYVSGGEAEDPFLGSPFALDAAMHAACVWGQRFAGLVPFPVGIDRRIIYTPARKGGSYLARIIPVDATREPLLFDAVIFDQNGVICESIAGLRMRDVTQGRMKPPGWIKDEAWKKSS
jgi:hypothetical protein